MTDYLKYKSYQDRYRGVYAEKRRNSQKLYYSRVRKNVIKLLGNKCKRCGFSDSRALQIDHINGGGVKELKSMTKMFARHVVKDLLDKNENYQLLCANCNWIKRSENNEVAGKRLYK